MRARSWMAALALIAGTSIAVGRAMPALSPSGRPEKDQHRGGYRSPIVRAPIPSRGIRLSRSFELDLEIAGLGREGCDVEVKPGNASCKFRAVQLTKDRAAAGKDQGRSMSRRMDMPFWSCATSSCAVPTEPARSPSPCASRDRRPRPSIAVSASRPGRNAGPGSLPMPSSIPTFTCYLSSPSKLAKADEVTHPKVRQRESASIDTQAGFRANLSRAYRV